MCLYPKLIRNKKYTPNKKNGGHTPPVLDERTKILPVGCGKCIECRKQKAREWQTRLMEDIKENRNGRFITLTFSNEAIVKLEKYSQEQLDKDEEKANKILEKHEREKQLQRIRNKRYGYGLDNEIATNGVRLFLERWRKEYKKSLRHWLVTELGHEGTENIHLHGIIWTEESEEIVKQIWNYGYTWEGTYVNGRTINYIVKYISKIDEDHKYYRSKILTSAGIGSNYTKKSDFAKNKYNGENTIETYKTPQGIKIGLPIYWRNKIYTDEEREALWIQKLDKQERWVLGQKIDISKGEDKYMKALETARKKNKRLGYGDDQKDWEREEYEIQRRWLMLQTRKRNASGGVIQKEYGL